MSGLDDVAVYKISVFERICAGAVCTGGAPVLDALDAAGWKPGVSDTVKRVWELFGRLPRGEDMTARIGGMLFDAGYLADMCSWYGLYDHLTPPEVHGQGSSAVALWAVSEIRQLQAFLDAYGRFADLLAEQWDYDPVGVSV